MRTVLSFLIASLGIAGLVLSVTALGAPPVALIVPAVATTIAIFAVTMEGGTRDRVRALLRDRPDRLIGHWTCDEASFRWSVQHAARQPRFAIFVVSAVIGAASALLAGIAPPHGRPPTAAFALGASCAAIAAGIGGFVMARREARLLRDAAREVLFGKSFVLIGDVPAQLEPEPALPDVAASVRLVGCSVASEDAPVARQVLQLGVLDGQRGPARILRISIAVPSSGAGDLRAVVNAYDEIAQSNRARSDVSASLAALTADDRRYLGL